jgi:hypothetical protein
VDKTFKILDPRNDQIAQEIQNHPPLELTNVMVADKWVLASTFQKAIRRGELEIAQSAGLSLLLEDKQMLYRRLHVLAVEDVGVGDIDLAICILAATGDAKTRQLLGGDHVVLGYLIERLCDAALDRTADHLLSIAQDHPHLEDARWDFGRAPINELFDRIKSPDIPLTIRAVAAWYAAGTKQFRSDGLWLRQGDLEGLLGCYQGMGVENALLDACRLAIRKMRNPLPVFLPLIWSGFSQIIVNTVEETDIPDTRFVEGVPAYALGGHTRLGKRALREFLRQCEPIRKLLEKCLSDTGWQDTSDVAVFHVESALVKRQRLWDGFEDLKTMGIEGDVCRNGLKPEAVMELMAIVRENMHLLDDIRVEILEALEPEATSQPELQLEK